MCIRDRHGGAKGGVLVEVVDQFRRGAVLEGDVFLVFPTGMSSCFIFPFKQYLNSSFQYRLVSFDIS